MTVVQGTENVHGEKTLFENVKQGFSDSAKRVGEIFTSTMKWLHHVGHNIESRKALHKLGLGVCTLATSLGRGLSTLPLVALTINTVDSVIDVFEFPASFGFFFVKQNPKRDRLLEVADESGQKKIVRKEQEVDRSGKTMMEYHTAKDKQFSTAAAVVGTGSLFFSVVGFLDSVNVLPLDKIAASLASLGKVGATIGKVFSASLVGFIASASGSAFFGLLALDSTRYLVEAYKGDAGKDKTKAWLQLATRVSLCVLFAVGAAGISSVPVVVPLLLGSGVFGLASSIYSAKYGDKKEARNEELLLKWESEQKTTGAAV